MPSACAEAGETLKRGAGLRGAILVTGAHDLLKCALAGGNGLCPSSSSSPSPRLDSPRCHFGQRIWLSPKMEVALVLGAAAPWVMLSSTQLKWPRHFNSIVAFFMRFLFLFNLLVPFFRPLCCFPFPSCPSLVCMTNMLFFSTLTSVLGLQETVCVSVWLSVCVWVCVWVWLCCPCECPADVIIVSSTLRI